MAICPQLCKMPPAALTPMRVNLFVFFKKVIAAKLKTAPAMLYKKAFMPPAKPAERMTRPKRI